MKLPSHTPVAPDGRLIAEQNELSVLELVRNYGHVRRSEIARAVWPRSSALSARIMAQRTVSRVLAKSQLLERPNALGGVSLVLGARGASRLRDVGIDAQDGLDLSSVAGPQFFHRTLGTRYLIERAAAGARSYGEYALSKGWAPVGRGELIERFSKLPDGIVTVEGPERGYDKSVSAADWLEVESSFKSPEELDRIFSLAWNAGTWLDAGERVLLDRVLFVYDARQRHESAILSALGRYLRTHPVQNAAEILSSIVLVRCDIGLPLVWKGCTELTAHELLRARAPSEDVSQ